MFTYGLNAAKAMLTNNDDNEVTITKSGLICRRMNDEGYYGDRQFRLTGNIMAFTRDNWNTVALAIGETKFKDPTKPEGEDEVEAYGVIAEAIVGKLIAGEKMYIGNENGSVQITGDGILLDGGNITWKNPIESNAVDGLNDFKAETNKSISDNTKAILETNNSISDLNKSINNFKSDVSIALGSDTTVLSKDSVISPKIGVGYLYIKDKNNNTGTSVEINPNGTSFEGHNDSYVFNVSKDNKVVMGVTNSGDGYFSGKIHATSGEFTGEIKSGSTITGSTIKSSEIQCGSDKDFTVDINGKVTAKNMNIIGGQIYINDAEKDKDYFYVAYEDKINANNYGHVGISYNKLSFQENGTEAKNDACFFNLTPNRIESYTNDEDNFSIDRYDCICSGNGYSLSGAYNRISNKLQKSRIRKIAWVDYYGASYLGLNIDNNAGVLIKIDSKVDKYLDYGELMLISELKEE